MGRIPHSGVACFTSPQISLCLLFLVCAFTICMLIDLKRRRFPPIFPILGLHLSQTQYISSASPVTCCLLILLNSLTCFIKIIILSNIYIYIYLYFFFKQKNTAITINVIKMHLKEHSGHLVDIGTAPMYLGEASPDGLEAPDIFVSISPPWHTAQKKVRAPRDLLLLCGDAGGGFKGLLPAGSLCSQPPLPGRDSRSNALQQTPGFGP